MAKSLSYQEFMDLSLQYYDKGGDGYYECWDQTEFNEYVKMFGGITKGQALKMYRMAYGIMKERMAY